MPHAQHQQRGWDAPAVGMSFLQTSPSIKSMHIGLDFIFTGRSLRAHEKSRRLSPHDSAT
jgi:endonuclease/exonuclease/phosphatase family metal-dependent hydrolase